MSKVAVVTGAARGIGAATVLRLSREGWAVVAIDRCSDDPGVDYPLGTEAELQAVVAACPGPAPVIAVIADVRDQPALDRAVAIAQSELGGLDAAVAGAGVILGGAPLWEMSEAQFLVTVEINLFGAWRLARAAIPAMLAREQPRAGRFIAIASAAAHRGMPRLAAYGAAKAGVASLIRGLAADLADTGVTANAVSPGSTSTAMLEASAAIYRLDGVEEFTRHHLLGRLLAPEEIAAAIAWLCSAESSALTGAVIPVDAGLTV
jgi:SDR family mycofactocin-dependent oxidoreductase